MTGRSVSLARGRRQNCFLDATGYMPNPRALTGTSIQTVF